MTHVHYHVKQTASGEALSSGEPSPEPCVDREGWEGGGRGYVYIVNSLYFTAETNTTL